MTVILVFIVFVAIGDAINIGISSVVERYSENASLFAFLAMFVVVFIIAWQLAVRITERYLTTSTRPEAKSREQDAPPQRPLSASP